MPGQPLLLGYRDIVSSHAITLRKCSDARTHSLPDNARLLDIEAKLFDRFGMVRSQISIYTRTRTNPTHACMYIQPQQHQCTSSIELRVCMSQVHFIVSSAYLQGAEADGMRVRFFNGVWFSNEVGMRVSLLRV